MASALRGRWSPASLRTCTVVLLAFAVSGTSALSQQYCSNQNTGSDYSAVSNNYQSNGACSTTCSGYAFAVVQGKSCWCSNYIPASQSSTSSCGVACPGYPYENCGDQSAGLFGYVQLGPSPSGTQGAASSQAAPSANSPAAIVVQATPTTTSPLLVPVTLALPTTLSTAPSSASPVVASEPTTSSTSSSSWSPTPVTQLETVTGQVKTLTITPTTPPAAVQTVVQAAPENNNSFSQSPGKIAGVSVAVVLVFAAIVGALVWFCLRRKRRNEEALPVSSAAGGDTPQRRPSRLSQMGLIGAGTSSIQKSRTPPTIVTSGWGPGNTTSAEKSPADTLERRSSYPRVVDQRLEPTALWNPLHDNGSHVSIRSFRDDQDYSRRMLRIANPDDA